MSIRTLSLVILVLAVIACNRPKPDMFLLAKEGDVKLEIDSVGVPELAAFPLRFKLTNNTNKNVVLALDTIANKYEDQLKNLYITADQDTFFLGIKSQEHYIIFSPRTSTSFLGFGYFLYGKGHFDSFKEIDTVFKKGRLEYRFDDKILQNIRFKGMLAEADTILVPSKLEASTDKAQIVERFQPESLRWREKKL
ncbi:hypothetical protein [Pontibacter akesuensis]|nr:hypothetical protein [Pontibacter akesuensis]GHA63545.1 hypothetical protein GCM10007389_15140 [Pontibacter akesuensis]